MRYAIDTRPRRFLFGAAVAVGSWGVIEIGRRIAGAVTWAVLVAFGPMVIGGLSLCAFVLIAAIRRR